jgi:hypothetical protein
MNCFNHPGVPAVGICKACQKGLCKECALDLGHGIACKNHREEMEMLNATGGFYKQAPLTFLSLGLFLNLVGSFIGTNLIFQFMGIVMLVLSSLFSILESQPRKPKSK